MHSGFGGAFPFSDAFSVECSLTTGMYPLFRVDLMPNWLSGLRLRKIGKRESAVHGKCASHRGYETWRPEKREGSLKGKLGEITVHSASLDAGDPTIVDAIKNIYARNWPASRPTSSGSALKSWKIGGINRNGDMPFGFSTFALDYLYQKVLRLLSFREHAIGKMNKHTPQLVPTLQSALPRFCELSNKLELADLPLPPCPLPLGFRTRAGTSNPTYNDSSVRDSIGSVIVVNENDTFFSLCVGNENIWIQTTRNISCNSTVRLLSWLLTMWELVDGATILGVDFLLLGLFHVKIKDSS
ncbi:hypothetical protein FNV43_RR04520 [Rhamnella rubrinervis]|uniref:Uncharacterized protein n=1 Tax=Rhamnella rubrinervis TaxID=2594499 RepID=A0A8K0MQB7_9ROSA|nr:hypothetical protein FNV43_RR04520 [Rhamnella rubrinervis]